MKLKIFTTRISRASSHESEVNNFLDALRIDGYTSNGIKVETHISHGYAVSDHSQTHAEIVTIITYRAA